jgi:hypothetical protein
MPPVRWACGLAASTENALIETIKKLSILDRLQILALTLNLLFFSL